MSKEKNKLVSIVILNCNGLEDIKGCFKSIGEKTAYRPFEIIVVDNGSKDASVPFLKEMKRKGVIQSLILNKENRGFGPGNNQGIAVAKGEIVFLLNNDTFVTSNWLENLVKITERFPKAGIVGPHFPPVDKKNIIFGGGYIDDAGRPHDSMKKGEHFAEQVSGGAFLIKRPVIDAIGFLDKGFAPIYFEESDYCARARRAGFKVLFSPKSKILHNESASTKKQTSKWRFVTINKNRQRFILIHFPKRRLLKSFFWEALRFGKDLVGLRGHWLLESWLVNLRNLPEIVGKRRDYSKGNLFLGEI